MTDAQGEPSGVVRGRGRRSLRRVPSRAVDYGLKVSTGPAWYLAGNAQYYQDRLKGIGQRVALGGSLGRRLRDTSFERWSVELGVSQVFEERGGHDSTGPAARWGFDYGRFLRGRRLELFHNHGVLIRAESDRGMSIDASTGVRYHLAVRCHLRGSSHTAGRSSPQTA